MTDCRFCSIAHARTSLVATGTHCLAFLDIRPIRPGHVLIVPQDHEPEFFDLPEAVADDMMRLARRIAAAQKVLFQPLRVGLLVAGFDVPHAHLHVVPMHDYHDLTSKLLLEGRLVRANDAELEEHRLRLSALLGQFAL